MHYGNLFDITFYGQSTISEKSYTEPDPASNFVGYDGFTHTVWGKSMKGKFLAMARWVVDVPGGANPALSLAERRAALHGVAKQLLPGAVRANQYRESVIWADVEIPE